LNSEHFSLSALFIARWRELESICEYQLFSWDAIEPFSYFDPDFIKIYEGQAQIVHMNEGSSQTADLKILPAVD
jgi:hypothetical protein